MHEALTSLCKPLPQELRCALKGADAERTAALERASQLEDHLSAAAHRSSAAHRRLAHAAEQRITTLARRLERARRGGAGALRAARSVSSELQAVQEECARLRMAASARDEHVRTAEQTPAQRGVQLTAH